MMPARYLTILFGIICLFNSNKIIAQQNNRVDEIKKIVAAYADARDMRDIDALRKLFTAEADQLVSSGEWRSGLDEMLEGMLRSSGNNPGDRTLTVDKVKFPTDDTAIADARYQIKGSDGGTDRNMWSTFIMVKKNDHWVISGIRNMLPAK